MTVGELFNELRHCPDDAEVIIEHVGTEAGAERRSKLSKVMVKRFTTETSDPAQGEVVQYYIVLR